MKLYESGEDYLEAVLILQKQMGESAVRSACLAPHMEYSKPSISHAVGILREGGFLTVDGNGYLHLTDAGQEIAEKIYERHCVLTFHSAHGSGTQAAAPLQEPAPAFSRWLTWAAWAAPAME